MKYEGIHWSGDGRMTVMFTIHVDGQSLYNRPGTVYPRTISYGKYGPERAVDRLLELTQKMGIACTYFVPGQIAETYPDMVKKIDACGYEIGFHGYDHEDCMYTDRPVEEWKKVIIKSQRAFERIIGKRAKGVCATSSDFSMNDVQIWQEMGFEYSSSMRGDDRPYKTVFEGKKSDFIEIPARWELDDYPAFAYNYWPLLTDGQDRISSYRGVLSNWKHEFDGYYEGGLCMVFMLHPQIIGIPGRYQMLEELMLYMKEKPDVWFAQGNEIADWWRKCDGK